MAKAKVRRGTLQQHPQKQRSLKLLKESGDALRPAFYEYLGSAVVHYYALRGHEFAFIAHSTDMTKVAETQASAGISELSRHLMSRFGRNQLKSLDPAKQFTDDGESNPND